MLAVIPYETFPKIALGPFELRTFGVMVGLGVLIGAWIAARYIEQHTGVSRDDTYRLATRLVGPVAHEPDPLAARRDRGVEGWAAVLRGLHRCCPRRHPDVPHLVARG